MAELKGPPCGFLGLGSSSGASGNNGGGRDFDLVLRRDVDRHEVADAASDVSRPDKNGFAASNKSAESNLNRPHTKREKQPARRGWSRETWSQIKLDVALPEPFAFLVPKKAQTPVARKTPLSEDLAPYTRSELLEILDMFPQAPLSAYKIKSAAESRLDLAAGRFKNEKDPARHTKGGTSMVIDENYLYTFVPPKKLGGPHKTDRAETLKDLDKLLVRIAHANLENTQVDALKRKLVEEAAAQKLRYEQNIRSVDGFNELTYLIKAYYDKTYEKVLRARKHEDNELYYHPADRLGKSDNEESVRKQLSTFTEVNVNSWVDTDLQDPTIVRSNESGRILANDDPDLPFHGQKELEFHGAALRAGQPESDQAGEARVSMGRQYMISRKSSEDCEIYLESQIAALGEEEGKEENEMDLQKVINQKYEIINRGLKALGAEDLINHRPQMARTSPSSYGTNNRDMGAGSSAGPKNKKWRGGRCDTCGTTSSPGWRKGAAGHRSLCNACGLRYYRKHQRTS